MPAVVPQAQPQEMAPAAKKAEPAKPQREPRRRVYRPRHNKVAAKPPQARQYTFFEMFFWGPPSQQLTYGNQPQNSQLPAYAQQGGQHQYQPAYTQQAGR
jgi:hypothetical protein